jgi:GT2 family glycosyltransferase
MMIRREWLERVGGFDSRFPPSEDVDITLRLSLAGCKAAWLKKIAVGYRQHSGNATNRAATSRILKQARTLEAVLDDFFARSDLPPTIAAMKTDVYHHTLVWLAWCFYRGNDTDTMSTYLKRASSYSTQPIPQQIAHWIEVFSNLTTEEHDTFDVVTLTQSSAWQGLVRSLLTQSQSLNHRQPIPSASPVISPRPSQNSCAKVSVIIPIYNDARYIAQALNSVLSQTYSNIEILVVDDGSTEDIRSALMPFMPKVRYVYKENGGAASARNRGLQEATGTYVAFLDADDFWLMPTHLADQVTCLDTDSNVGIVHSGWKMVDQDGTPMIDRTPWDTLPDLTLKEWVSYMPVFLGAMLFRRD